MAFGTIHSYPNNPRVMKAVAAANINGLTIETPEFTFGVTNQTPEFKAKFPYGKVPVFEGANGETLIESDAIAQYAAESGPKAEQLLGKSALERAQVRQWASFGEGDIMASIVKLVLWRMGLKAFDAETETAGIAGIERSLAFLEGYLQGKKWLVAGEELSLADISVAAALYWGFVMAIDAEIRAKYPTVMAWYERVVETEGVKQAFGEKKLIEKRQTSP